MLLDAKTLAVSAASSLANTAEYTSADAWWPQQILCHGAAVGIGWPSDNWPGNTSKSLSTAAGGPPEPASVNVAFGATSGEALGTIVAHSSGSADDIRLVEAFSVHVLDEIDQPDGRANLDDALHGAGFGSLPGGEATEVIRQPPVPPVPPLPAAPGTPGPGIFADRAATTFAGPDLSFVTARTSLFAESNIATPTYSAALRDREVSVFQGGLPALAGLLGGTPGPAPQPAR